MIQEFSDFLFEERYAIGCSVYLQYDVTTHAQANGREQRILKSDRVKRKFILNSVIREKQAFDYIHNFYMLHYGNLIGFRFKDLTDFALIDQPAKWDSASNCYQICKKYSIATLTQESERLVVAHNDSGIIRKITRPEVNTIKVTIDGKQMDFTYLDKGKFMLESTEAYEQVLVSCEFTVPVRFDVEALMLNNEILDRGQTEIALIEILE